MKMLKIKPSEVHPMQEMIVMKLVRPKYFKCVQPEEEKGSHR